MQPSSAKIYAICTRIQYHTIYEYICWPTNSATKHFFFAVRNYSVQSLCDIDLWHVCMDCDIQTHTHIWFLPYRPSRRMASQSHCMKFIISANAKTNVQNAVVGHNGGLKIQKTNSNDISRKCVESVERERESIRKMANSIIFLFCYFSELKMIVSLPTFSSFLDCECEHDLYKFATDLWERWRKHLPATVNANEHTIQTKIAFSRCNTFNRLYWLSMSGVDNNKIMIITDTTSNK